MIRLFKILSVLPLWFVHGVGIGLGWFVFLASGVYRRRFLDNVHQAELGWREWYGAVGECGKLVAELPRLWLGAPVQYQWDNDACVEKAYLTGRGVIFLTPHLGCFEIPPQGLVSRYGSRFGPLTGLYRPPRQTWLAEVMGSSRQRPGLNMVPTNLAGVRQMIRALRNGEAVGLLPDQVPPEGMGRWVPFMGRPAYTMTLAARLAQQTGATVLLAWGERLSMGRGYMLHFREMQQDLDPDLVLAMAQINQAMAQLIQECPQQYLWGYARYKHPRRED